MKSNSINEIPKSDSETARVILVVEDDRTHRSLMEKILEQCGFSTIPAENGVIALSKLESESSIDLIIMDLDMPEMDGLETVKNIRAREVEEGRRSVPVLAFTAHKDPSDREKCVAAGMSAYLPKDVWMPKWRQTLVDNLQGLIAGDFQAHDFEEKTYEKKSPEDFDLDAFDMDRFDESANLLNDELPVAIDEFLEDAAAYIRDISEGFAVNDSEKVARGSHPLKSNSKGFGLTAVSEISQAINNLAREGNLEPAQSMLAQLQEAFKKAEKKLRDTMKSAGY